MIQVTDLTPGCYVKQNLVQNFETNPTIITQLSGFG